MAEKRGSQPYKCHIFVCVNDRHGGRKSCADENSKELRIRLKKALKAGGWPSGEVRVTQSLCMGLCAQGPNVLIYPQEIWFSGAAVDDVDGIVAEVERILQKT